MAVIMNDKLVPRIKKTLLLIAATCVVYTPLIIHSHSQAVQDRFGYRFHEGLFAWSQLFAFAVYVELCFLLIYVIMLFRRRGEASAPSGKPHTKFVVLCLAAACAFSMFIAVSSFYSKVSDEIIFTAIISKHSENGVNTVTINGNDYEISDTLYEAACDGSPYISTVRTYYIFGKEHREVVFLSSQGKAP
jgi:hypothetical protein